MPELPDITVYIEALRDRILGHPLERYRVVSPFILRSVEPPLEALVGLRVTALRRLGKRIVLGFETDLWLVVHLMIAGRFQWRADEPSRPAPNTALVLRFDNGTLFLTEAGTKKRASVHVARGEDSLASSRSWRSRDRRSHRRRVSRRVIARQPHAEARADRSATC